MSNRTRIIKKISSAVICMLLAVAMIIPVALPDAAYAASGGSSSEQKITKATSFTAGEYDITFKKAVVKNEFLSSDKYTDTLRAKGRKKSIKLYWTPVKNTKGISGYYIVRKEPAGGWYEIATVSRSAKSYVDKTAKTQNTFYQYTLVPYAKYGSTIYIAKPASWAGAITTKSSKKNVKSLRLERAAKGAAVRVGGKTTVKGHFSKDAYSKALRWKSSNTKVAKISSKGVITGVKEGKATITARTHTGYVLKFTIKVVQSGTAKGMLDVMRSWMGYSYYNQKNRGIVDIYNSVTPLPYGYKMGYYDAWCDCTISAAAIVSGNEDKIGRNVSVPKHVSLFKQKGIWLNGCKTVPKAGDLVVFNWSPSNKNNASHIGIVEKVEGKKVTTIEGNMGIGVVGRRTYTVGWKYVKGYARPKYKVGTAVEAVKKVVDNAGENEETDAEKIKNAKG